MLGTLRKTLRRGNKKRTENENCEEEAGAETSGSVTPVVRSFAPVLKLRTRLLRAERLPSYLTNESLEEEGRLLKIISSDLPHNCDYLFAQCLKSLNQLEDSQLWRPALPEKTVDLQGRIIVSPSAPPSSSSLASVSPLDILIEWDVNEIKSFRKLLCAREHSCATSRPHAFFTDKAELIAEQLVLCFDQYEGLRRVGDLRGIPKYGGALHSAGLKFVTEIYRLTLGLLCFSLLQIHDAEKPQLVQPMHDAWLELFASLQREYDDAIGAIVSLTHCQSSLSLRFPSGENFNDHFRERFISEVIKATAAHERKLQKDFEQLLSRLDSSSNDRREQALKKVGGREKAREVVQLACGSLRQWVVESWLTVQKNSFSSRTVYGTEESVKEQLEQSMEAAVEGFKACLEAGVADPLIEIPELFENLTIK